MKDAFGGSFILRIMLTFFVVFICFMTASITISKVFRIKNNVINILERSDPKKLSKTGGTTEKIDAYLQKSSYSYANVDNVKNDCIKQNGTLTKNGVCIVSHINGNGESNSIENAVSVYYKVTAYGVVDFPLFLLGTIIPVSGESKVIYLTNDK